MPGRSRCLPGWTVRLGAYLPQAFLGNHYAYASLGFRREFYCLPAARRKKIYWAGWDEAGSAFGVAGPTGTGSRARHIDLGAIADIIAVRSHWPAASARAAKAG